jgi:hypothetical protein
VMRSAHWQRGDPKPEMDRLGTLTGPHGIRVAISNHPRHQPSIEVMVHHEGDQSATPSATIFRPLCLYISALGDGRILGSAVVVS